MKKENHLVINRGYTREYGRRVMFHFHLRTWSLPTAVHHHGDNKIGHGIYSWLAIGPISISINWRYYHDWEYQKS